MKEQGKQHEQVGNWKLFDVLKHLAGWAVWRVEATENLLAKGVTDYSHLTDLDDFNSSIVTERAGYSWDQVVKEIIDADETWIMMLDGLSEDGLEALKENTLFELIRYKWSKHKNGRE